MAEFTQTLTYTVHCPACGGDQVVKHGTQSGEQRYRCKTCRKAFRASGKPKGRRMDSELIASAVSDYYSGKSYKAIAEGLEKEYNIPEPSKATVYEWVRDYSADAVAEMKDHKAKTGGGDWVADEMYVKVGGKTAYLWDIMDTDTRYILASHLSYRRDATAARAMLRKALAASDGPPKSITTDKWRAYIKPIKDLAPEAEHIQSEGLAAKVNNNLSERLQGTLRDREKTLRGLENIESGQRYVDGFALNYNLFRKHHSLSNKPPAATALEAPPFREWADVVKGDAVELRPVLAAPRRAEGPEAEIELPTPTPRPLRSSRESGDMPVPKPVKLPQSKVRVPKVAKPKKVKTTGKAKGQHPVAKLRNGIQRAQRKNGRR